MQKTAFSMKSQRKSYREYTQANRAEWAEMGYRQLSSLVHDDDREFILASLEYKKYTRMVTVAESTDTDSNVLLILSRRNLTKMPSPREVKELEIASENCGNRAEIIPLLAQIATLRRKFAGIEAQYADASDETQIRMAAKAVAYSGLTVALMKLAYVHMSEQQAGAIFATDGEKVEAVDNSPIAGS